MELGFAVKGAGPLSQISVPLFTAGTCMHLATGAYGWWKTRERAYSLSEVIKANGGTLTSTSSFDRLRYRRTRESEHIRAVSLQPGGKLLSLLLPKASTAISDDVGLECVRAVVTALLVFYNATFTIHILEAIIPEFLINQDQEDRQVVVEGPLLATLQQYVTSVEVEEEGSTIREKLLELVQTHQHRVSEVSLQDLIQSDSNAYCESDLIVGLLRWILQPAHRRETSCYPTRSLRIWALALLFSGLGFSLEASLRAVASKVDYELEVEQYAHQSHSNARVVLVVRGNAGRTDVLSSVGGTPITAKPRSPRLRRICIDSLPSVEFRHLGAFRGSVTLEELIEIWRYSFHEATSNKIFELGCNSWKPQDDEELFSPQHRPIQEILSLWSSGLMKLVGIPLKRYLGRLQSLVTSYSHPEMLRDLGRFLTQIKNDTSEDRSIDAMLGLLEGTLSDVWHIMTTIIAASILGACSRYILENGEQATLASEVAILPGFLYRGTIFRWINLATDYNSSYHSTAYQLHLFIEVFCGGVHEAQAAHKLKLPDPDARLQLKKAYRILGVHLNGMTLVSDFLVRTYASGLGVFHLQAGRPLDIAMDEHGIILGGTTAPWVPTTTQKYSSQHSVLDNQRMVLLPDRKVTSIRIDLEPDWKGSHEKVLFLIRCDGIIRGCLDPVHLWIMWRKANWVRCSCGQFSREKHITVGPVSNMPFECTTVSNILTGFMEYPAPRRPDETRAFVLSTIPEGTSEDGDATAALIATQMASGGKGGATVLTDCLGCVYGKFWDENGERRDKNAHLNLMVIIGVSRNVSERMRAMDGDMESTCGSWHWPGRVPELFDFRVR